MVFAYKHEPSFKLNVDKCDESASFEEAWKTTDGRFPVLREFAGGLATVFPNTASVESDFSVLGWEKNEHRKAITDFSLEGVLQSRQMEVLSQIPMH